MKKIITLFVMSVLCLILTYVLHTICIGQNIKIENFERNIENKELNKINEITFPIGVNNFIGFTDNSVYLTEQKLKNIIKYDFDKKKFLSKSINHKNHNSNILGNTLFSFDPYQRKVYIYDVESLTLKSEADLNIGFDRALAINNDTILLRSATNKYTKMEFSGFSLKNKNNFNLKIQLNDSLEFDGGLKTDGYFTFRDSIIIFTQFKKGNLYKIDNTLKNIKHYATIDNIQDVEGVQVSRDSTFYFTKPVLNTNLLTSVYGNKVYVISFVKGNNNALNKFTKYRMLDVYDIDTGKYLNSFYLPNNGIEKAIDFYVNDNKIYLLFNKKMVVYELN